MQDQSIARRYASALFAEAEKSGTLDSTAQGLETVAQTIAGSDTLRKIVNEPVLTPERKKEALKTVFGATVAAPVPMFLNLLVDKRRVEYLPDIQAEFARLVRAKQKVQVAVATTAVPLSDGEQESLRRSLETRTGGAIDLKTDVDPAVIGGVFVRIGDMVYDGTVRGNLERLREQLLVRR